MNLADIANDIDVVESKLVCADNMIHEGNKLLKACVSKMNQQIFIEGQQKVEVGLKRKAELITVLDNIKKKRLSLIEE